MANEPLEEEDTSNADPFMASAILGGVTLLSWKVGDAMGAMHSLAPLAPALGLTALAFSSQQDRATPHPLGVAVFTGLVGSSLAPYPSLSLHGSTAIATMALANYVPKVVKLTDNGVLTIVGMSASMMAILSSFSEVISPKMLSKLYLGAWALGNTFAFSRVRGRPDEVAMTFVFSMSVLHIIQ